MDSSVFLARLIGPALVVTAIALATQPSLFASVIQDFIVSPGLAYVTGLLGLLAGLTLVLTHNTWSADWGVLITIIGWIVLVKAVAILLLPRQINDVGAWFAARRGWLLAGAAFSFVVGAVLCTFGYWA